MGAGYILREEGTRENPENIQERPQKQGNKLHIAGWVNWHAKCEKLEFYNDEEEEVIQPPRPRKPRKRMYESPEEWEARMLEWEATKPQPVEVKPKGNSMTQKYYVERLLPVYAAALDFARQRDPLSPWVLQEDNDGSHGTRSKGNNLAKQYKKDHNITCIIHPAQSPDLNPIEACWNIIKIRIRHKVWTDLEELKRALQEEWDKITMDEIH